MASVALSVPQTCLSQFLFSRVPLIAGMAPKGNAGSRRKRVLDPARVTPALVTKTLKDNYLAKGLSDEDVYVHKIDGKTLSELTREDLTRRHSDPSFKMGFYYFKTLRDKYRNTEHPSKRLKVDAASECTPNPALLKAMVRVKKNASDMADIQAFLGSAVSVNRAELVGICRWALDLRPSNGKHLLALVDVLRFFKRMDIKAKYSDVFSAMFTHMEESLCTLRKKNKSVEAEVFCRLNDDVVTMFLQPSNLDLVLAAQKDYPKVETHIQALVTDSAVGDVVWGFAHLKIIAASVDNVIKEEVLEFSKGVMNLAAVNNAKFAIAAKANAVVGAEKLPNHRDVQIPFQGESIPGAVTSIQMQVNVSLAACWKGAAVATGLLKPFFSEDSLVLGRSALGTVSLEEGFPKQETNYIAKYGFRIRFRYPCKFSGVTPLLLNTCDTHGLYFKA